MAFATPFLTMTDVEMDQVGSVSAVDPDPITEVYDVYIQPHISEDRQIYVLQFPNRDSKKHYTKSNDAQPLKLRVKPESGMLETDVPLDVWHNYDREKGLKWGDAMNKSNMSKGGGSHGMPGGFGIGGAQPTGRGRGRGDAEIDSDQSRLSQDYHYREAVGKGQVLAKQTLGGDTISNEELASQYLIGVYRGNQLHLIPADQIAQMRPQFHHIDAHAEQERLTRARDPASMPARAPEARAIHMTVKASVDGEDDTTDTMAERITATQAESWQNHQFIDEDDEAAWRTFEQNLFVEAVADAQGLLESDLSLLSVAKDPELLDTTSVPRETAKLSRNKKIRRDKRSRRKEPVLEADQSSGTLSSDSEGGPLA